MHLLQNGTNSKISKNSLNTFVWTLVFILVRFALLFISYTQISYFMNQSTIVFKFNIIRMLYSKEFASENVYIVIALVLSFVQLVPSIFNMFKNTKYTYIIRLAIVFFEAIIWILIPICTKLVFQIGMVIMVALSLINIVGLLVFKFNRHQPQLSLE